MRMEKDRELSTGGLIFVLVGGLFMGSIFTFGMQHQNASVKVEDAIHTKEIFASYKICYDDGDNPDEVMMYFKDGDCFYIDEFGIDEQLLGYLEEIKPGTEMELIVHPNSNYILDMKVGGICLLEFEDSMKEVAKERKGFFALGIFTYTCAIWAIIEFSRRRKQSKI